MTEQDERVVIHANSNVSRGKFAAAAVHAALTAAGVHPGLPVIVLSSKPADIGMLRTVIHDAGRTEVEPGTVTAGTDWAGGVSPTAPDEREALASAAYGDAMERYMGQRMHVGTATDREIAAYVQGAHFGAGFRRSREATTEPQPITDADVEVAYRAALRRGAGQLVRDDVRAALEAVEASRSPKPTGGSDG